MVFASNLKIRDEDNTEDENNFRCLDDSRSIENRTNNDHASDKPRSKSSTLNEGVDNFGATYAKKGTILVFVAESTQRLNSLKRTKVEILKYHLKRIFRLRHHNRQIPMIQEETSE